EAVTATGWCGADPRAGQYPAGCVARSAARPCVLGKGGHRPGGDPEAAPVPRFHCRKAAPERTGRAVMVWFLYRNGERIPSGFLTVGAAERNRCLWLRDC